MTVVICFTIVVGIKETVKEHVSSGNWNFFTCLSIIAIETVEIRDRVFTLQ